ncbi:MAG: DVU_1556 family methyltransferase [Oscillospiraceae bacterium]
MGFYDECRGPVFRPGGYALTRHAVNFCNFPKGAVLADVGCGTGDVMRQLRDDYGFSIIGIEPSEAMSGGAGDIIAADAENTTLPALSCDGVLCECVLSLCPDFIAALSEMNRILKDGGYLIVSDVCAKIADEVFVGGSLGYLRSIENILKRFAVAGFKTELMEDRTDDMITKVGELIMAGKGSTLYENYKDLKQYKCGYFLLIAKKCNDRGEQ